MRQPFVAVVFFRWVGARVFDTTTTRPGETVVAAARRSGMRLFAFYGGRHRRNVEEGTSREIHRKNCPRDVHSLKEKVPRFGRSGTPLRRPSEPSSSSLIAPCYDTQQYKSQHEIHHPLIPHHPERRLGCSFPTHPSAFLILNCPVSKIRTAHYVPHAIPQGQWRRKREWKRIF